MTLHVIGAGLAGLACALAAVDAGLDVELHEAVGHAGGRCRSWFDPALDRIIDNGSHMVVGGNRAVFRHLARIGSIDQLATGPAALPMLDLASDERWTASPARLLPSIIAAGWRMSCGEDDGIAARLGRSRHYRNFWQPLALAVMNTPPDQASAPVFRRVLARTLWRGAAASRPHIARHGLSAAFVDPALAALTQAGASIHLRHPLRGIAMDGSRVAALEFDDVTHTLSRHDAVVLAVPWWTAAALLPDRLPALPASPIVNAHFRVSIPVENRPPAGMLGLLGGTGEWLFLRGDVLSVTVSAAASLLERSLGEIADQLWSDVANALDLKDSPLAVRIIKEKRATLFHSPEVEKRRPSPRLGDNLVLAGDWTATGLPCTLEGALLSGERAARDTLVFIAN
ncbi:MAG TPA: FAD-dependent oxidoreductase [Patescibacteria group bacterium]|nr:FAD-dependent oxidoreductase [Patescibacteria group bacterium]